MHIQHKARLLVGVGLGQAARMTLHRSTLQHFQTQKKTKRIANTSEIMYNFVSIKNRLRTYQTYMKEKVIPQPKPHQLCNFYQYY